MSPAPPVTRIRGILSDLSDPDRNSDPVFGALWGALFLGEVISPTFLVGAVLVFVSLALILNVNPVSAIQRAIRPRPAPTVPVEADDPA